MKFTQDINELSNGIVTVLMTCLHRGKECTFSVIRNPRKLGLFIFFMIDEKGEEIVGIGAPGLEEGFVLCVAGAIESGLQRRASDPTAPIIFPNIVLDLVLARFDKMMEAA